MFTLILATFWVALAYGALWHAQPARRLNNDNADYRLPLGRVLNRAVEWLLLMPHVPTPAEKNGPVPIREKSAGREKADALLSASAARSPGLESLARIPAATEANRRKSKAIQQPMRRLF